MGLLDRFRNESATRVTDTSYNWNKPSTYFPDLIGQQMHNLDDMTHRLKVAREDPYANVAVFKIANAVFADWFKFVNPDNHDEEIMQDCQVLLKQMNAKQVFIQCLATERWAGWCWQYLNPNANYEEQHARGLNTRPIAKFDFFNPIDANVIEYDEWRNPVTLEISNPSGAPIRISAKNCIEWRTRPYDRTYKGDSVLAPAWTDLVRAREIKHAMSQTLSKFGAGFVGLYTGKNLTATSKANIEAMYQNISTQTAVLFDGDNLVKGEFIGPNVAAVNFEGNIGILIDSIAAALNIPKDLFFGLSAGMITGSETNIKILQQTIGAIQQSVEPYIRDTITALGFTEDYDIVWNVRYAHDEESQARIRMMDSQTDVQDLQLMSLNELREIRHLPPLEGGDIPLSLIELRKAELGSQLTLNTPNFPTPDQQNQTRNPEGTQI